MGGWGGGGLLDLLRIYPTQPLTKFEDGTELGNVYNIILIKKMNFVKLGNIHVGETVTTYMFKLVYSFQKVIQEMELKV